MKMHFSVTPAFMPEVRLTRSDSFPGLKTGVSDVHTACLAEG